MEADIVTMQDVFVASPPSEGEAYAVAHRLLMPLRSTGIKPHFLDKLAANNVVLPASFFSADDSDQVRASFAATGFPELTSEADRLRLDRSRGDLACGRVRSTPHPGGRRELVPIPPGHVCGAEGPGRADAEGERPCRGELPGAQPRPDEEHRPCARPFAVDARSSTGERTGSRQAVRERGGGRRSRRRRRVRALRDRADARRVVAVRSGGPDRRDDRRLAVGHRSLRRDRGGSQPSRRGFAPRARNRGRHRWRRRLELTFAQGRSVGSPRCSCGDLRDRHRRAGLHVVGSQAARGRHRRLIPPSVVGSRPDADIHCTQGRTVAHVAAHVPHDGPPGRARLADGEVCTVPSPGGRTCFPGAIPSRSPRPACSPPQRTARPEPLSWDSSSAR